MEMESLIEVINKLQDVFSKTTIGTLEKEIQLPEIIVIGAQSAGKSSVLEAIVGRDFLPRGIGIVTRRPLVLKLKKCPKGDAVREKKGAPAEEDWAVFKHCEDQIFTDFEEVRKEIDRDTDRIAGENRGIMREPINLTIYSHRFVELTLVDLPGMVKNPVGDQPKNIEEQVRAMILDYIENQYSIILAVTPANQDFATSESISLANSVDPEGDRTLAVLTKLDLMDRGTNAIKVLTGETIPVKLGIVGVVNRSQEDIDNNKGIVESLNSERAFLQKNYPNLARTNGIEYLAEKLNELLMNHIFHCLPKLRERIQKKIEDCESELKALGTRVTDKNVTFFQLLDKYAESYKNTILGTCRFNPDNIEEGRLFGGAQISAILHQNFFNTMGAIKPLQDCSIEKIHSLILNLSGYRPALLVPDECFQQLAKSTIEKMKKPSLDCVAQIYSEMKEAIEYCLDDGLKHELKRFPRLHEAIANVIRNMLEELLKETKKAVEDIISHNVHYINTKHPDFMNEEKFKKMLSGIYFDGQQEIPENVFGGAIVGNMPNGMTKRDKENCQLIAKLIRIYFNIVRKIVQDAVPKAIHFNMVKHIEDSLRVMLNVKLNKPEKIDNWLEEDRQVASRRELATQRHETLLEANGVLSELHCFSTVAADAVDHDD